MTRHISPSLSIMHGIVKQISNIETTAAKVMPYSHIINLKSVRFIIIQLWTITILYLSAPQAPQPLVQLIKSYSPQPASPAKTPPPWPKTFYLPAQHRHDISVMLSIFCSVPLCFMGLPCAEVPGWMGRADLDSLPVWACGLAGGDIRATSQPGTRPVSIISQPQRTQTPPHVLIQEDIMFSTCWWHMWCSQTHSNKTHTQCQVRLSFRNTYSGSFKGSPFALNQSQVFLGTVKESSLCSNVYRNVLCKAERWIKFKF